jgi:glycine/D-amino acid oxidase-like deaminating enzyme
MASISADVAIVGGGLMGCYSANFLRRRGRSVVVIDKGSACAAASGVNFGNLRLQGRAPQEFPLSLRSRRFGKTLPASPERIAPLFPAGTFIWDLRQAISPSWNAPRTMRVRPVSTWSFWRDPLRAAVGLCCRGR